MFKRKFSTMKICVIGFGAAGIVAARYASVDHNCTVYERTDSLGGTWFYTDKTGKDNYGLPIHTSMYKNLRTNLPKELMGFSDFPMDGPEKSFVSSQDVFSFLKAYVEKFDLKKFVKFGHIVINVIPEQNKWKITFKNLKNDEVKDDYYDAVMVCSGHHYTPLYPEISGMSSFTGYKIHSHDYRQPDDFKNKTVLVIGAGFSGSDIAIDISSQASKIFLSCSSRDEKPQGLFVKNIQMTSEVEKIDKNKIYFQDGLIEDVDAIIYCTGYAYDFPFLHSNCGIKVEDNYVFPLYKHMLNINHPTMAFIGIPYRTVIFITFEIQIKCFLNLLHDVSRIPSKEEMMSDMKKREEAILEKGLPIKRCHNVFDHMKTYCDDITRLGGLDPIPEVIYKIYFHSTNSRKKSILTYKNEVFKVIDSENFISTFK